MVDENKRFVEEFANPHSWLMMADNLHEQATEIYKGRSLSSIMTKVNANREIVQQTRGIDKSVFLLGGFALENAIKAFLVYENPSWVSNGRLSGRLKSHSLTGLQKQSKLIPDKNAHIRVLKEFESGLDSWFRYPCALTVQDTKEERHLFQDLWDGYEKLMRAYAKKLVTLLNKGWNGPHDYHGRWIVEGETLGYGKPLLTVTAVRSSHRKIGLTKAKRLSRVICQTIAGCRRKSSAKQMRSGQSRTIGAERSLHLSNGY